VQVVILAHIPVLITGSVFELVSAKKWVFLVVHIMPLKTTRFFVCKHRDFDQF